MEITRKRIHDIIAGILFFLVVAFLAYGWRLGTGREVHSDETSIIFIGLDMFDGNLFWKGWDLSTGIFGLTTIELAIVTAILGYHDTIIYVIVAINYALMIMASAWVIQRVAKKELKNSYIYSLIAVLIVVAYRNVSWLNAGTHVLSYAVAIVALYFTYYLSNGSHKIWVKIGWGVLLGLLAVTNSTFLYTTCVPIILTGVLVSYGDRKESKISQLVLYGIISLASYAVFKKLWVVVRGAELGGIDTVFTTRDSILNNMVIGICNVLELYGINFWGENVISLSTCKAAIGFLVLAKLTYEIYKYLRNGKRKEKVLIYLFLIMAFVNVCAYIFSTLPSYSTDTNLLLPFLIGYTLAGILAWIHNIGKHVSQECNWQILGLFIIFFLLMFPAFTLKQPDNTDRQHAAEYLVENGYENGFGSYWEAASVMYEADGEVTVCPVIWHPIVEIVDSTELVAYKWMNKTEWEQQKGTFLIVDSDSEMQFGINEERIIYTFGEWTEMRKFGNIIVYTWDAPKTLEQ